MPIIFGALASWSILETSTRIWIIWTSAFLGLVAGLMPAIRDAIGLDVHVEEIALHAARFKNLQDRFRLAADTSSGKNAEELESEVRDLMELLDDARKASVTPPERCFVAARKKIKSGHYHFTVDSEK